VVDEINQVATASEEQSSTAEQISKSIESINNVTNETATGIQQVARSAEDLNSLNANLQVLISQFKINNCYCPNIHYTLLLFSLNRDINMNRVLTGCLRKLSFLSAGYFLSVLIIITPSHLLSQEKVDYSPKYSGYIRAWHQTDFSTDMGQFLLKQVRFGAAGSVNEYASYKLLVDFTRLGRLSTTSAIVDSSRVLTNASATFSDILLDAAATLTPIKNLSVTAGQFKVPFSTDNLRADQTHDFANRPLHTSISLSRDIGVTVSYKIKGPLDAELTAGAFNGSGFNKTENDRSADYVFRAEVSPVKNLSLSGNYYSGKSQGIDLSYSNFGFNYKMGDLFVDAEYTSKISETAIASISGNSYFTFATYTLELPGEFLRYIIPGVRYEMLDPGDVRDNDDVTRLTMGLTFGFAKFSFAHVRINYEKFDYKDGTVNPDKLIIELQTRF
jgi:hypothetical protein